MTTTRFPLLLLLAAAISAQAPDYSPEKENAVFKTQAGKQLEKDDVQCGAYFWESDHADKHGIPSVYYFYGDPAYGKNKLGLYHQSLYTVAVNPKKDPPTVQMIRGTDGGVKEIRVQITEAELNASRTCFPLGG